MMGGNMSASVNTQPTVLAVDDSTVMQTMIKRALAKEYRLLVAGNAIDALALIYHQPVSIMLLDVSMPGVDGLELCRTLRSLPQFRTLPIIMLTARDGAFDRVQGRLAGATEYLTKPFEPDQLREVVKNFIEKSAASKLKQKA
jgi:twitching motility two-component system response regulator PilG